MDYITQNIEKSNNSDETKKILHNQVKTLRGKNLPVIYNKEHLLYIFEIDDNFFLQKNYHRYSIKKKRGGTRHVYQPNLKLKAIQRWILKKILNQIKVSSHSHAYRKDYSILSNAKVHYYASQENWLYATDIEHFFDSIPFRKVKKMFFECGYSEQVSELLTHLCTAEHRLVQGFPTSPTISNIIFKKLDEVFYSHAKKYGIRYSRYADDLFFSGGTKEKKNIKKIKNIILYSLKENNFNINESKSRFLDIDQPKKITGLMVNELGISIPQRIKRKLLKDIYYCEKFGVDSHLARTNNLAKANFKGYLYGYVNFIKMVEPEFGDSLLKRLNNITF